MYPIIGHCCVSGRWANNRSSVRAAKAYIGEAIRAGAGYKLGAGYGRFIISSIRGDRERIGKSLKMVNFLTFADAPGVMLENVSFSFSGAMLFSSLDFEIKGGQWTCLLGPSGCGKSTLLRLISGSLRVGFFRNHPFWRRQRNQRTNSMDGPKKIFCFLG